jgi:glucokinase
MAIVLSEFALTYMPGNGIYLAGGLMRSLNEFIDINSFMQAFIASRKPMHAEVLKEIPLGVINAEMTCLHGNLAYLKQKLEGQ